MTQVSEQKRLNPRLDVVFWMLFGAEQNRQLLISLLRAVLHPTTPIASVEVLHAQPERLSVDEKSIALDLRVRLANGEEVDVEMQSQRRPAQRQRALFYWSRLYSGQLQRGAPYADLQRCIVVWITDFTEMASARFHSIFRVLEVHDAEPLTSHLELHWVELPKLPKLLHRNDEPDLVAWGKFLTAVADDELEALAKEYPVLKQAKEALDRLSADPEARLRAEQRELALFSNALDLTVARAEGKAEGRAEGKAEGRAEGKAEGRAEGKAEGRAETLRELLTLKFGPLPSEIARRLGSATEAELQRWATRVLSADSLAQALD
jgi:predicted transposase/invertase (TIGR01784 family)